MNAIVCASCSNKDRGVPKARFEGSTYCHPFNARRSCWLSARMAKRLGLVK